MNKKETGTCGEAKGMPLTIKGRRVSKDYLIEHGIIKDYFESSKGEKSKDCTYKDTIYRQDAIDAICKACSMEEDYHKCDGYPEASTWCDELVALRALPSAQPEQRWIPCSERLPQPNEEAADGFIKAYLVQDGRWMDVARWNGDCWIAWGYGTALTNVIAWMPLPEPYVERRTDEAD